MGFISKELRLRSLMALLFLALVSARLQAETLTSYIEALCSAFRLNPYFVFAVLTEENPTMDERAVHSNTNNTRDLGLFQLNSAYVASFERAFWRYDYTFDVFNGRHNALVAISLLDYYMKLYNSYWYTALVFHAGEARAKKPLDSQVNYANRVLETADRNVPGGLPRVGR